MSMSAAQRRELLEPWLADSRRLTTAEARDRARRRYREKRGLSVAEHEAIMVRRGPTDIVRRTGGAVLQQRKTQRADDPGGDGLNLTGYATTFDQPYDVDSYFEGTFTETIARGAFADSLRRSTPVMLFDHGLDVRTGSVPIAAVKSVTEDRTGVKVSARLFDNEAVRPVRQAIAGGAIRGMSIMMRVLDDEWTRGANGDPDLRTIRKAELFEAGPVVWPANPGTSVGVRSKRTKGLTPAQRRANFIKAF
ncbi:HK97 family phage prohead protease [Actinopolymorpha sp. B11F2]|uniref:HK97 family phage prohead protease n=1 Tax=Actinopolymorpha sp. B11F2 TaxID=3160862 RepID=UPI0032E47AD1